MQIDGVIKYPKGWHFITTLRQTDLDYCPDCWIRDKDCKLIIRKKEDNNG
jgi:hypothetical protein